ncbi:Hypothetical_protein [Hexamita inflata]|uniref:Hypothetical_protein n=1 Tax=Hexamita inflata TaxID=28002 RepID=A0AA86QFG6_9EUKA|nr:Hypothetical protein HINF_LOCUS42942 [Hexamita inflata]
MYSTSTVPVLTQQRPNRALTESSADQFYLIRQLNFQKLLLSSSLVYFNHWILSSERVRCSDNCYPRQGSKYTPIKSAPDSKNSCITQLENRPDSAKERNLLRTRQRRCYFCM